MKLTGMGYRSNQSKYDLLTSCQKLKAIYRAETQKILHNFLVSYPCENGPILKSPFS